ncbi:MAG TPA: hypothetical protein DCZ48_00880 [Methylococcaceae bacterium]|nr:hypothetical protein [Methylococcaceae bacterium]
MCLVQFKQLTKAIDKNKHTQKRKDFCSATKTGKGRIVALCNPFRFAVDGQKDQLVGYVFRRKSPNYILRHGNAILFDDYRDISGRLRRELVDNAYRGLS